MTFNPIKAYRNAAKRRTNAQAMYEAKTRICISDYTSSFGRTYPALVVDGIPVMELQKTDVDLVTKRLEAIREEYIKKRFTTI
jgi:hypothetical protein